MDQVDDSLNMMTSALRGRSTMDGSGDASTTDDVDTNEAIMNTHSSPAITAAADLPSFFIKMAHEVGMLFEFRDLVLEEFPQLRQKLQTYSNVMQLQTTLSPSKWEPGVRVKRKLGQQLRGDSDMLEPSLLPRYRSNSQGKASRSSEVSGSAISSAIQDSGFCTESNKDHSSAISSRSKSRETEDELFSLLDHIHNKGTRLKLEVEYLWNKLSCKSSSSLASSNKRRCKSLNDLISTNAEPSGFTFECAMRTTFLETELNGLKKERDLLLNKLADIESEHRANLTQTNQLLLELESISAEKRDLEERLQIAIHSENSNDNRINDLSNNFLARNHWRSAQTPVAKGQLLNLMQVFKEPNQGTLADEATAPHFLTSKNAISSTSVSKDSYYTPEHSQSSKNYCYTVNDEPINIDRPANPVTKELNIYSYQTEGEEKDVKNRERETMSTSTSVATLASTKDFYDSTAVIGMYGTNSRLNYGAREDKPEILSGFQSGHLPSIEPCKQGGITLSKEKVLSILNEYDPTTLHRFLLTLSYQLEALNSHVQRISKSRVNIFEQLEKCKKENDDLKLELELKDIKLEATKAEKRELERMRNEKLCYSTSDLTTSTPKARSENSKTDMCRFVSPMSDTVLLTEKTAGAVSSNNLDNNIRCLDLSDSKRRPKSSGSYRHNVSRIPLKTYSSSKLPTKLNTSNKKTLTSFKEYSTIHSSCISCTSSSLSNK